MVIAVLNLLHVELISSRVCDLIMGNVSATFFSRPLVDYYIHEFGACHAGSYDPFRLIIWEDAAETILSEYRKEDI